MLRIPCPYCGSTRDEDEFTFGGPYDRVRPAAPQNLSDEQWADYLFTRDNTRGNARERWRHTFGCRQWFGIERDTVSHALVRVFTFDTDSRHGGAGETITGGMHEVA
ncbi:MULTISPECIES: sarcosine oxidase subunit delta [Burkholderia]|uniref:sarcosine oxidase subunit delta n=1 Tax=Burkholderia TaxID=32008 RepID=UPI0005CE7582|nr:MULTISPECIES: sarcosine oxidase subunit delta [Burkholderia]MEB2543758.1 sarcosine oxidase subunit delta [Burkholderia cenocepacia]TGN99198.1 sarcosine oxidase subunit delta [Burkholderia sp. USMB20]